MAAKDIAIGNTGNLSLGASDAFTTICDVEIFEWRMSSTQERIESTTFATSGIWRTWYMGTPTVTVDLQGHYPSGVIFPYSASVVAGKGTTAGGQTPDTLTLTSTTGETITLSGRINNPRIGVNRRTGLNSLTARFIGKITAAATA